jgi:hypothetical protein
MDNGEHGNNKGHSKDDKKNRKSNKSNMDDGLLQSVKGNSPSVLNKSQTIPVIPLDSPLARSFIPRISSISPNNNFSIISLNKQQKGKKSIWGSLFASQQQQQTDQLEAPVYHPHSSSKYRYTKLLSIPSLPSYKQLQSEAAEETLELLLKVPDCGYLVNTTSEIDSNISNGGFGINPLLVASVMERAGEKVVGNIKELRKEIKKMGRLCEKNGVVNFRRRKERLFSKDLSFKELRVLKTRMKKGSPPCSWKELCEILRREKLERQEKKNNSKVGNTSLPISSSSASVLSPSSSFHETALNLRQYFYWLCDFFISLSELLIPINENIINYLPLFIVSQSLFCRKFELIIKIQLPIFFFFFFFCFVLF